MKSIAKISIAIGLICCFTVSVKMIEIFLKKSVLYNSYIVFPCNVLHPQKSYTIANVSAIVLPPASKDEHFESKTI